MPQCLAIICISISICKHKFNTFHGNPLNPTDTTNYSLFSHGFFETNPYAEIITKKTSNDRKITHPKSTGRKPGCKTFHPAAVQNERQRTKIYQIGPPSAIQAGRCGRMARVYKKFTNLILFTGY